MFQRSYSPPTHFFGDSTLQLLSHEWEFVKVLDDSAVLARCLQLKEQLSIDRTKKQVVLIIGIGGSSAGALAILQAYYGLEQPEHIRWYCADTFHEEVTTQLLRTIESHMRVGDHIITCIISKSGTTTETLVNASLFVQLLWQSAQARRSLIVISNEHSPLHKLAYEKQFHFLPIPTQLGGRFSVFSAVGIMPLLLCDVPVAELLAGARTMQKKWSVALSAAHSMVDQYKCGKKVLDIFITQPRLWSLALWYRQLIGESLGKNGRVGFVPTITQATTDLHSVTQKILGGPNDTFTHFISCQSPHALKLTVDEFTQLAALPAGMSVTTLHTCIMQGVKQAYDKKERVYTAYELDGSATQLGAFMHYKMLEIAYAATLLDINPFDQPEVELYKQETRALLHTRG